MSNKKVNDKLRIGIIGCGGIANGNISEFDKIA